MTMDGLIRIMWIFITTILVITIGGFIIFVRWGKNENEKNRIRRSNRKS
ncbi:MAG: hypothetical protein J0H02_04640 [Armatimonadetes bacterium]|nr:hypothetical protein [Armatimonadota bacterium]